MEFRAGEEPGEPANSTAEETKTDSEKVYFGCGNEMEDAEFRRSPNKNSAVAPKPSDVRNGDLVSLLLAATPPYLYNIPLVPQSFFFSEMLKSFVQAKTERQNLKAQQTHHRRQRKRHWREVTPPKPSPYEPRDKPLELTTPKAGDDKGKGEKCPPKKYQQEGGEKKLSELGNFSVEKLANSSIGSESSAGAAGPGGERLPPAGPPPLWYPLLYPPHPPYGIDPLHFFIDLRVSAHFWDRNVKMSEGTGLESTLVGKGRHPSAFRVPSPRKDVPEHPEAKDPREKSRSVHYVVSSLREIYKSLEKEAKGEEEREGYDEGGEDKEEEEEKWQKNKDLRAVIGLELVVDYVKQESDGEDEKPDANAPQPERNLCIEQ